MLRRKFLFNISWPLIGLYFLNFFKFNIMKNNPIVISTWRHGYDANQKAWEVIQGDGNSLE